jgi:hypothetical protein
LRGFLGFPGRLVALGLGDFLRSLSVLAASASASAPTPPAAATPGPIVLLLTLLALFVLFLLSLVAEKRLDLLKILLDRSWLGSALDRPRSGALNAHASAFEALIDHDFDRDAVPALDLAQLSALLVEKIDGSFTTGAKEDLVAAAAGGLVFDYAQRRQPR